MNARKAALLLALALSLPACFRTNIRSGSPVGSTPIEYDDKWHSGVIFGIAELSGPYDLHAVCPQGWSQIHTETTFVNGLVQALTQNIYTPQSVTVRCSAASRTR